MTGMDDASLVKATLGGDQSAFGELARRYRDAAFGIAFHRLGDFEAARDAAQEALVTAYVELPMLREPSKFGNWLYRIATMSASAQRRRRRVTVSIDDSGFAQYPSSELSPDEAAERAEKARRVQEALSALAEADRLAVILHYVDGYSHEEIGGILGTSVSAVKSRVHRAKRHLREEMQSMVKQSLKESVLERFDLKPLRHWAFYGYYYGSEYANILQIKVTHVFGRSTTVAPGEDYLVCGEYVLTGSEEVALTLAVPGRSTAHVPTLQPGRGKFELYCHVEQVNPGIEHILSILMPDDKSWIQIQLGEELDLRPLNYSLRPGYCDPEYAEALQVEVKELLGTSRLVAPGEIYVVRGEYTLMDPTVTALCVDADGTTTGFQNALAPGRHSFETMGKILKVTPGREHILFLHMFADGADIGSRCVIELQE